MPGVRQADDLLVNTSPRPSLVQRSRIAVAIFRQGAGEKVTLGERLRSAVVKPADSSTATAVEEPLSFEELEDAVASANDKERLIGLLAAPIAAAIGILVVTALIANDPASHLRNGQVDRLHVSVPLYQDLGGVVVGLSLLMLVMALWRKRLLLGIVMALYGLAIFNLHYWGFGIPFIMGGAWLLVRAYRLQRDLRLAGDSG